MQTVTAPLSIIEYDTLPVPSYYRATQLC